MPNYIFYYPKNFYLSYFAFYTIYVIKFALEMSHFISNDPLVLNFMMLRNEKSNLDMLTKLQLELIVLAYLLSTSLILYFLENSREFIPTIKKIAPTYA